MGMVPSVQNSDRTLADLCMKLAREETKNKVNRRSSYCKNNQNRSRNCTKNFWNPEPEPRQNGTGPQQALN
jgi:hypothetical protein